MPTIDEINRSLTRVKIRLKGNRLYLRATLTDKNGSVENSQQDLSTGLPNTQDGLRIAKARAQRLESDLNLEKFKWSDWTDLREQGGILIATAIKDFTAWYWETRGKTQGREQAFSGSYLRYLNLLPTNASLTPELIRKYLVKFPVDTDSRRRAHLAYGTFARWARIPLPDDWKYLKGKYEPKSDRYIPNDEEIEKIWESIKNPAWRWVFGMLATYGLRPHELFHLDRDRSPVIRVLEKTKTGERLVYPVPGNWVKLFNLPNGVLPNIKIDGKSNQDLGQKISQGFWERDLPVVPYGLRDGYAVRCAILGVDSSIAAKWMGHSIDVHCKHYQKYIDSRAMQKIWERLNLE